MLGRILQKRKISTYGKTRNFKKSSGYIYRSCSVDYRKLAKITKYSKGELEALHNHFLRKSEGKNQLSRKQFSDFIASFNPDSATDGSIFDSDTDGNINFKEFAVGMSVITESDDVEKYKFLFDLWDIDGNGVLTKEEFKSYLQSTSQIENKDIEEKLLNEIFASIDLTGDGTVDFEEFRKGIIKQNLVMSPKVSSVSAKKKYPFVLGILGQNITLNKGDIVIQQDSKKEYFYLVKDGELELKFNNLLFDTVLGNGDTSFIGEDALFDTSGKHYYDAVVTSDTVSLLAVPVSDIMPLIYHSHTGACDLLTKLGNVMVERLTKDSYLVDIGLSKEGLTDFIQRKSSLLSGWALHYHSIGIAGKISIAPVKEMGTLADLSVAYSPGVAEPCLAIKENADKAYEFTSKGHLVGVVSNGTAVLGLGNIGALASKPVMEGKAVLFKKLGKLDSFDIEINENDPDKLIDHVVSLEPTFGGINLEDIKAPECFYVEKEVQKRMNIPIMHDDQHGTAIIAGAGLLNALELVGKDIKDIKAVVCGVGAAGFTCARYFMKLGVRPENLITVDINGVVHTKREDLIADPDSYLHKVAANTSLRTLTEAIVGADVFLGVSAPNLLSPEMLLSMNPNPLVFALANPVPEISFLVARQTRKDVLMATGRSDFPNQINNVCAFPYIFRGAIDSKATCVNEEMKFAASEAIALLARTSTEHKFGPDYIIPKPFDRRLFSHVSSAVARAAIDSGASKQVDFDPEEFYELK
eukprot:TRINITY_DN4925_c0_g1_i1.p1 TRINITY_DN4925_c0_g1~~TRINITY_DN4925_c0_g1_i1.p1  ORF type:complete len:753 (-),score=189.58 TRINITY_DN4925_c0_g1_i1:1327-3585(-)